MTSLVLLLLSITGLFVAVIGPIWWVRKSRKSWPYWQTRWWAIVLGGLLVIGGARQRAPLGEYGGIWLIAWGIRGKRQMLAKMAR